MGERTISLPIRKQLGMIIRPHPPLHLRKMRKAPTVALCRLTHTICQRLISYYKITMRSKLAFFSYKRTQLLSLGNWPKTYCLSLMLENEALSIIVA